MIASNKAGSASTSKKLQDEQHLDMYWNSFRLGTILLQHRSQITAQI